MSMKFIGKKKNMKEIRQKIKKYFGVKMIEIENKSERDF